MLAAGVSNPMWTTARRLTSCSLKISSSQPRWTALPRTIPGLTRWRCRLFSMASLLKQWKPCWAWRRNHAWCPIFCRVAIPSLIFLLQHNDWKSVERVCVGIVQMCHQCKDTVALNENVVVLAKRCGSAALSIEPVWPALQPILQRFSRELFEPCSTAHALFLVRRGQSKTAQTKMVQEVMTYLDQLESEVQALSCNFAITT